MAVEYVLTDVDTLRGLAQRYGVGWLEIAEFNGLEYPYTLTELKAQQELYASGYLKIQRTLFTTEMTIYAGSTFTTAIDAQGIQKTYELVDDVVFPAGASEAYGFIRCTLYGTYGNTVQETITHLGRVRTSLGDFASPITVSNPAAIVNGTDAKVRITGQTILIPSADDLAGEVLQQIDADNYLNMVGGEDLLVTADGDITDDGLGDLATLTGADNIAQAIYHRLLTPKGSNPKHPDYGSDLHTLIGKAYLPYINSLIEIYVHEALAPDDRFRDVQIGNIRMEGTTIYLDIHVYIVEAEQYVAMNNSELELSQNAA